jgi:hypothetical protein
MSDMLIMSCRMFGPLLMISLKSCNNAFGLGVQYYVIIKLCLVVYNVLCVCSLMIFRSTDENLFLFMCGPLI